MGFPSLSQRFESTVTIGRPQFDRKDFAQLAIEVGVLGLGPLQYSDHDVPQRREAFGYDPQRHRLAGSRLTADQGKAAFLDKLFHSPGKAFNLRCYQQAFTGEFGRKRVPFQSPQG